jgi:hypothetical protein
VRLVGDAATADGIAEILVEEFLALLPARFLGEQADLRALLASLDAVALTALADVPALSVGVGDVAFGAAALRASHAHLSVPDLVRWAGAGGHAVGLVADVLVLVTAALAWAVLEDAASRADLLLSAGLVGHLLETLVCADQMRAVDAWDFNSLAVLVEFAVVQARAVRLLDAGSVQHDLAGGALTADVAAGATLGRALELRRQVVACPVAEAVGRLERCHALNLMRSSWCRGCCRERWCRGTNA